jgi:hypothetical protein
MASRHSPSTNHELSWREGSSTTATRNTPTNSASATSAIRCSLLRSGPRTHAVSPPSGRVAVPAQRYGEAISRSGPASRRRARAAQARRSHPRRGCTPGWPSPPARAPSSRRARRRRRRFRNPRRAPSFFRYGRRRGVDADAPVHQGPRERAYDALLDPTAVGRWRVPAGMTCEPGRAGRLMAAPTPTAAGLSRVCPASSSSRRTVRN